MHENFGFGFVVSRVNPRKKQKLNQKIWRLFAAAE
jgi:hypothetical protein